MRRQASLRTHCTRMDLKQCPEALGPGVDSSDATGDDGNWIYRCLRKGEEPWNIRNPLDLSGCERKEIRAVLLEAVSVGNVKTSPFLHGTRKLDAAKFLRRERAGMYNNWLIRWPMTNDKQVIDLSDGAAQSQRQGPLRRPTQESLGQYTRRGSPCCCGSHG